jgi:hypothetical protein
VLIDYFAEVAVSSALPANRVMSRNLKHNFESCLLRLPDLGRHPEDAASVLVSALP